MPRMNELLEIRGRMIILRIMNLKNARRSGTLDKRKAGPNLGWA